MTPEFTLRQNGDSALDIFFDATPGESLSRMVIGLQQALEHAMQVGAWPELRELIPAYQCLTVCYDPLTAVISGSQSLRGRLQQFVAEALSAARLTKISERSSQSQLVEIPVCYDDIYGPDLNAVCTYTGLSKSAVIELHCKPDYLVHMLGFTPGFLYLGGLDQRIHCPRKDKPALRVAAGSVGIGGSQTGIYPQVTPGGWQIIGRTPLNLFAPEKDYPFIAHPLDRIHFVPISIQEFEQWGRSAREATVTLTEGKE